MGLVVVQASRYVRHARASDIRTLASVVRDAEVEGHALGSAAFDYECVEADLEEGRLQFMLNGGPHACKVELHPDRVAFIVFLDCVGAYTVNRGALPPNSLITMGSGREYTMRGDRGALFGALSVERDRLQGALDALCGGAVSLDEVEHRLFQLDNASFASLSWAFGGLLRFSLRECSLLEVEALRRTLFDDTMSAVVGALAAGESAPLQRVPSRSSYRTAFSLARDFLEASTEESVSVEDLCRATGFSARVLFYAFQEYAGVGPKKYLRLQRLARVRKALQQASASARVGEIAARYGFWEFGRFAREYREVYGELPSATLARPAVKTPSPGPWSLAALRERPGTTSRTGS